MAVSSAVFWGGKCAKDYRAAKARNKHSVTRGRPVAAGGRLEPS